MITSESSHLLIYLNHTKFLYSASFRKRSFRWCRECIWKVVPQNLGHGCTILKVSVNGSANQRWDEVQIQWPCVYDALPRHYKTKTNNLWSRNTFHQFPPSLITPSELYMFDFCRQLKELMRKLQSTMDRVRRAPGELETSD